MASSTSALMIRNFYWDRFYKVLCNDLLKKKMTIYMFLVKLEIIKLLTLLLGHGEIVRKGVSVRLNFQTTSSDTWHSILFYWPTVSLSVVDTKTKKWTAHMRENYKGQRFLHFLIMTHIDYSFWLDTLNLGWSIVSWYWGVTCNNLQCHL